MCSYKNIKSFSLFVGKSLDGLFHLWHIESDVRFSEKQAEMWIRLTREHVPTVIHLRGPRELVGVSMQN